MKTAGGRDSSASPRGITVKSAKGAAAAGNIKLLSGKTRPARAERAHGSGKHSTFTKDATTIPGKSYGKAAKDGIAERRRVKLARSAAAAACSDPAALRSASPFLTTAFTCSLEYSLSLSSFR